MSNCCCRYLNGCKQEISNKQFQEQFQEQFQYQGQDQDTDQESKVILRGVGNNDVNISIDNVSVAVAVLATFGLLTGALDGDAVRSYLDRLMARE